MTADYSNNAEEEKSPKEEEKYEESQSTEQEQNNKEKSVQHEKKPQETKGRKSHKTVKKRWNFFISITLSEKITQIAKIHGLSISGTIEQLLEFAIQHYEKINGPVVPQISQKKIFK